MMSVLAIATFAVEACSTSSGAGPSPAADGAASDVDGGNGEASASTWCARLGGVCEPLHGTSPGVLCASHPHSFVLPATTACDGACCISPDAAGDLPADLRGYGVCGNVVCVAPAGATCYLGVDSEGCTAGAPVDAGVGVDSGTSACGVVNCQAPLQCTDAARSRCSVP